MFDIGGWEFLVIVVVAIVVIGPKDLPATIRTVTGWARKARSLAREFRSGLDEVAREMNLDEVGNEISAGVSLDGIENPLDDIKHEIEDAVDPTGEFGDALDEGDEFPDDPLADAPPARDDGEGEQTGTAAADEELEPAAVQDAPGSVDDAAPAEADEKTVADAVRDGKTGT